VNKIWFGGRAGKDPELMKGQGHGAKFSIASGERYLDKKTSEWKERTTWMNIQAWGKLADFVMRHVRKGEKVNVTGKIAVSEYNDKTYVTIVASEVEPSVFHKDEAPADDNPPFEGDSQGDSNDDIPF
jgi:single-strand DNA-binding protein